MLLNLSENCHSAVDIKPAVLRPGTVVLGPRGWGFGSPEGRGEQQFGHTGNPFLAHWLEILAKGKKKKTFLYKKLKSHLETMPT